MKSLKLRVAVVAVLWLIAMFMMPTQLQVLLVGGMCFSE